MCVHAPLGYNNYGFMHLLQAEKGVNDALGQLERGWLSSGTPVVAGVGIGHGGSSLAHTTQPQLFMTGELCVGYPVAPQW